MLAPLLDPYLAVPPVSRNLIVRPPNRFDTLLPHIVLPNLDTYVGPSEVARFVIPRSGAVNLTIFWTLVVHPEDVLPSFSLSNKNVDTLDNAVAGWDQALFSAIAR